MERLSHIITDSLVALVILQALQQHDSQALEVHHLTIDLLHLSVKLMISRKRYAKVGEVGHLTARRITPNRRAELRSLLTSGLTG